MFRFIGKSLFKRAILLTGSALTTWAIVHDPLKYALKLAAKVNCSHPSTGGSPQLAQIVSCLKAVPSEDLANARVRPPKYHSAFGPVVDRRTIVPTDVAYLMEKSYTAAPSFPQTELLVGVCGDSGYAYFTRDDTDEAMRASGGRGQVFLRTLVQNVFRYHRQKVFDILAYHYRDWERPRDPVMLRENLAGLVSDGLFAAPTIQTVRYHASLTGAAPVYLYSFSYSPTPYDAKSRWETGAWFYGSELAFALGAPLVANGVNPFRSTYTRQERSVSETLLRYLTNFIKCG